VRDLDSLDSPSSATDLHHDLSTIPPPPAPNNIRDAPQDRRPTPISVEPLGEFRYIVPVARRLGANASREDWTIASP